MIFILENIGYILCALGGLSAVFAALSGKGEGFFIGAGIALITIPVMPISAGMSEVWSHPDQLAVVHMFALFLSFFLRGGLASRVMYSLALMILVDVIQSIIVMPMPEAVATSNQALIWWRSAINVIYAYQCIITIHGCMTGLMLQGCTGAKEHGNFMARIKGGFHHHR